MTSSPREPSPAGAILSIAGLAVIVGASIAALMWAFIQLSQAYREAVHPSLVAYYYSLSLGEAVLLLYLFGFLLFGAGWLIDSLRQSPREP